MKVWKKTLELNGYAVCLYGMAAVIYFTGVVIFAYHFSSDWWKAGRAIWVATALGSAIGKLGDIADRMSKRKLMQQQEADRYMYTETKP
jgi:hypothetical protein